MNLVLEYDDITSNNIFFHESVKNTVMNDSSFIRLLYSNNDIVLNGIFMKLDIYKDKNKVLGNYTKISDLVENINNLEKLILNHYNPQKLQSNKLKDQLNYHINKINNNTKDVIYSYLLKISGIWETDNTIGLTYKFIYMYDLSY